jgi:hypothetical protein
MTSAGAGEKSVQDTHIYRGAHKELLDDGGGEHTCTHGALLFSLRRRKIRK